MANAVLFVGWKRPFPGSEDAAYGFLMGEGTNYLKDCGGKFFERMEMIGLTPHGGGCHGFILFFGERARLDEWRRTDEFEAFSMRLGRHMEDYTVVPGLNLEGIQAAMARQKLGGPR